MDPIYPIGTIQKELGFSPQAVRTIPGIKTPPVTKEQKALLTTSMGMESLFILKLFESMRATAIDTDLFGENSRTLKIFRSMQDEETAKNLAASGGIGLASVLYNQMVTTLPAGSADGLLGPAGSTFPAAGLLS